jgi:hypothetical protein
MFKDHAHKLQPKPSNPNLSVTNYSHRETHQHQPKEKVLLKSSPAALCANKTDGSTREEVHIRGSGHLCSDYKFLSSSVSFAKGTRFCSVWKRKHAEA